MEEKIIKEISLKFNEKQKTVKILLETTKKEGYSIEHSKEMIEYFYNNYKQN